MNRALPFTHSQLAHDFRSLGARPGQIVMLHASVKAVGEVMGGPNIILHALLEALTPAGTLMMYAGWQDMPDGVDELRENERALYYAEYPAFDPAIARAVRENSILAEFLRTFPATRRSANPEASMIALGADAVMLTENHALNYGYGPGSPLERLIERRGSVLMLGAPLDTITLLHYAENVARMRHKTIVRTPCPILIDGVKQWVTLEDYDTGDHHDDYTFEEIAQAYIKQVDTPHGNVGNAQSYLFDAADLSWFAVGWLEGRFGKEDAKQ